MEKCKRRFVHGLSPNAKKEFTDIRRGPTQNSSEKIRNGYKTVLDRISADDEEKSTNSANSNNLLDDSFDYTEFDFIKDILGSDDAVDESKSFLSNLKSLDLMVNKILRRKDEVIICAKNEKADDFRLVLRGFWVETEINVNEKIRIFVPNSKKDENSYVIDADDSFILIKPDVLLTPTSISTGVFCRRKTILNEKFQCGDPCNKATLVGNLVHELFQKAVVENVFDVKSLKLMAEKMLADIKIMEQMYFLNLTYETIWDELNIYVGQVSKLISMKFQPNSLLFDEPKIFFKKIHDVEENIWMPKYGVRGKIDLTVEVFDQKSKPRILPLELKTGRTTGSAEHKGQVSLYTAMLTELYENSTKFGCLLYLKDSTTNYVELKRKEFHGIIQLRNTLAHFLDEFGSVGDRFLLPEPLKSTKICSICPQLLNCSIFEKFDQIELNTDDFWVDLVSKSIDHLSDQDLNYFKKWLRFFCLETLEKSKRKLLSDIWTVSAAERENRREALCDLQVRPSANNREIILVRAEFSCRSEFPAGIFNDGQYAVLSNVTIGHVAIAMGTVGFAGTKMIKLSVDQKLVYNRGDVFRLDHYGSNSTYLRINLGNLTKLFFKNQSSLRSFVVGRRRPLFHPEHHFDSKYRNRFNEKQFSNFTKVLQFENYVLIKISTNSDKSKFLSTVIESIIASDRSILLAGLTNSALDSVLVEFTKNFTGVLRLDADAQVDDGCKKFTIKHLMDCHPSISRMKEIYDKSPVVAATCSTIGSHPLFARRRFDVVLVCESRLLHELTCLGPLFCAEKFILIGGDEQQCPAVTSNICRTEGMDVSLFDRLALDHPNAVVNYD